MGERKVINKYFPPDFDPSKIPRTRKSKSTTQQIKVRTMLPMTVRCKTCGNYIYAGTKFNSWKEEVKGDDTTYLGIKKFRLYSKCTNCSAEIVLVTDPQNSDYVVAEGATTAKIEIEEEEEVISGSDENEKRMVESKREMDRLANLEELKSMKARRTRTRVNVSIDAMLAAMAATKESSKADEDDDERLVRSIFGVRRIDDDDYDKIIVNDVKKRRVSKKLPINVVKRPTAKPVDGLHSLIHQYDGDDD